MLMQLSHNFALRTHHTHTHTHPCREGDAGDVVLVTLLLLLLGPKLPAAAAAAPRQSVKSTWFSSVSVFPIGIFVVRLSFLRFFFTFRGFHRCFFFAPLRLACAASSPPHHSFFLSFFHMGPVSHREAAERNRTTPPPFTSYRPGLEKERKSLG